MVSKKLNDREIAEKLYQEWGLDSIQTNKVMELMSEQQRLYADEIIGDGVEMFFSDEIPVFNSLQEWMDRVAKIREIQREEMRTRNKGDAKDE